MSGYLQDGRWHEGWYDTAATAGEFIRIQAIFRSVVTADLKTNFLVNALYSDQSSLLLFSRVPIR